MVKKQKGEKLFNPLKRKVLRKRIAYAEILFALVFIMCVAGIAIWVDRQGENYDAGERDISFAVLQADSVEDNLYRKPVARWREPGTGGGLIEQADLKIFPQELLGGGWKVDGRVETYNPENLYEKINGAAEQYLNFGFEQLYYVTLASGDHLMTVEWYDQGAFQNALGIFAAQRDEDKQVNQSGQCFYYQTPAGAIGIVGSGYFKITGNSNAQYIVNKAQQLIGVFGQMAGDEQQMPGGFVLLTQALEMPFSRVAYQKNNVFQYGFASDFWFGVIDPESGCRYFVHQAADELQARQLYNRLCEEQGGEYQLIKETENTTFFRHEFLNTWFMVGVEGVMVFGVDGASSQEILEQAGVQISEVMSGGEN